MHAISPSGTIHNFPAARHAVAGPDCTRLYATREKTEWVADIPCDWTVVAGNPKSSKVGCNTIVDPFHEYAHHVQRHQDRRSRKTIFLFGVVPLFTVRVGFDA